jgi:16S rRNA (adenine1518-N6/adenine1519-N6)-dimethyltransferase
MRPRSTELLKKYNIRLKKSLGQNLLLDPNINRKMADVAEVGPADSVFEVGSGIGDLTGVLADRAGDVLTVEIDSGFEPVLRERFANDPGVKLFIGDVLNHPVKELVDRFLPDARVLKMVSNLPFYITSPILTHFLEGDAKFTSLTVMVQKEVAERIVATPGGKDYGILSIACQLYARPYIAHAVSPKCFRPTPKVDSAIVHLPIRDDLRLTKEERTIFFKIVNAAFGQRRKKLINALAAAKDPLAPDKVRLRELLHQSGVPPDSRAETISLDGFVRLALLVSQNPTRP